MRSERARDLPWRETKHGSRSCLTRKAINRGQAKRAGRATSFLSTRRAKKNCTKSDPPGSGHNAKALHAPLILFPDPDIRVPEACVQPRLPIQDLLDEGVLGVDGVEERDVLDGHRHLARQREQPLEVLPTIRLPEILSTLSTSSLIETSSLEPRFIGVAIN